MSVHSIAYIKALFINIILCLHQAHSVQSLQPLPLQTANILTCLCNSFHQYTCNPVPQQANQKEIQMNLFFFWND